ncbi:HU family DNA-binding protein [Ornithobacterium rhinotracheale]|uniref:DNA-binding protein, histone-like, putative n=1 Tax=Ornithobacterium rhinotracheale (strain ATCC 51463 / DSM 15997 / CCUG 23171 / CIP 104009 / LMG 9086) TaxID=867902 RepID=I3ZXR8_ORNRL|nr:HU family DNA-binding protein [Ornithobacterium rhinotracheale]AFL96502.1 DNA-binding protein, histone-like, putative [Ornithobacterium rhinotracheale DSM 15997]AIP98705.1 DNA-binding protein [Ornithobacterium rhinotracheale ORT-UMN 88]KGB67688.1 DNA-binding protein [Ornithobacterium rhinotracheale H06-030791]MBN3662211.1 DNA-binding protein [Ornithobacterium rhinotracheale]MCK0194829.1 HU family DNA-binding protein [Ornithobacterium rhinotracheale]
MPVFYNKIQKKNPSKPSEPAKWYLALRSVGMLKEKEVAVQISEETTLNPKEAEMALAQFEKVLIRALLNGQTVQLGDWGSFHLTLNSEGAAKEEDATPNKVKRVNIRFTPGQTLKDALAKVELRDAKAQFGK